MTNAALVAAQLLADADAAMLRRKILLVCYTAVSTTLTVPAARKAQGHLARAGCRVRADHPFAKPQGNVSQRGPAGPVESTPGQRAIAGLPPGQQVPFGEPQGNGEHAGESGRG